MLLTASSTVLLVINLFGLLSALSTESQFLGVGNKFDSNYDRDSRFADLYIQTNKYEEPQYDKRIAFTIRSDPILFSEFLLVSYVILNNAIEPLLHSNLRPRIRFQNLLAELLLHIVENWSRIVIPEEMANLSSIFTDQNTVNSARIDMHQMCRGREGQQVMYCLLIWCCGIPSNCIIPLIIRDLPLFIKAMTMLYIVGMGDKVISYKFKHLYDPPVIISTMTKKIPASNISGDSNHGVHDIITSEKVQTFVIEEKISVVLDFICEILSAIVETFIFTRYIIDHVLNIYGTKVELPNLIWRIITIVMIIRYTRVRSEVLGEEILKSFNVTLSFDKLLLFFVRNDYSKLRSWIKDKFSFRKKETNSNTIIEKKVVNQKKKNSNNSKRQENNGDIKNKKKSSKRK